MITLHVQDLRKSFGSKTVFSDINFSHRKGSLGIAGANGSGKSTFLKCLARILRPTGGSVRWLERDDTSLSAAAVKKRLGYVAPYINLYRELSCRENLQFLTKVRHQSPEDSAATVEHWLSAVGLKQVSGQPFGNLSTGQQQRLRLASGLFHNPDILLLDEPGSNLDDSGRALIEKIVREFGNSGKLLILASNSSRELKLCDRIFSVEEERFTLR